MIVLSHMRKCRIGTLGSMYMRLLVNQKVLQMVRLKPQVRAVRLSVRQLELCQSYYRRAKAAGLFLSVLSMRLLKPFRSLRGGNCLLPFVVDGIERKSSGLGHGRNSLQGWNRFFGG